MQLCINSWNRLFYGGIVKVKPGMGAGSEPKNIRPRSAGLIAGHFMVGLLWRMGGIIEWERGSEE